MATMEKTTTKDTLWFPAYKVSPLKLRIMCDQNVGWEKTGTIYIKGIRPLPVLTLANKRRLLLKYLNSRRQGPVYNLNGGGGGRVGVGISEGKDVQIARDLLHALPHRHDNT